MKKILFFAAVFATALVSCSSDDNNVVEEKTTDIAQILGVKEVASISQKAAGTTLTVSAKAGSRANITGNSATLSGNTLTIEVAPVVNGTGTAVKTFVDDMVVKYKPTTAAEHIYKELDLDANANEYVSVSENANAQIVVTNLDKLVDGTVAGVATTNIEEWTYEVSLWIQDWVSQNVNKQWEIKNPLKNIMTDAANNYGYLLYDDTKAENIKVKTTQLGETWYEAVPFNVGQGGTTQKYNVRVLLYQGESGPTATGAAAYKTAYVKASIHVQPVK